MPRSTLLALSLFVLGCGPRTEDTGPQGTIDPGDSTCTTDSDCESNEICEADACEPGDRNDVIEEADTLLWEDQVDGEINPADDVDWYSISAEGGEFVRISVVTAEEEGGLDSVVSVYTPAGKRLVWEDEHPAGNVSSADSMCFAYFAEAGTYSIKVEDVGTFYESRGNGGDGETYTLVVEEWSSVVTEPDSAQETGLDFGAIGTDTLYSMPVLLEEAGDADWAAIELPEIGAPISLVAVEHAEESDLSAVVTVRNEAGDTVLDIAPPTAEDPGMLPNPEGTSYVIGVTDASGAGGDTYWTWVFFVVRDPGGGNTPETEPNDEVAAPEVVELEDQDPDSGELWRAYRQGRISTETDADVYAFDVTFDDAYVSVGIGSQLFGGLLVPRLELLDATGTTLETVDSAVGTDTGFDTLGPYAAGTYYLRVTPVPETGAEGGEGYFYLFGLVTFTN